MEIPFNAHTDTRLQIQLLSIPIPPNSSQLRASAATTPEDVSHSRGRNVEGILRMEDAGTSEEDDIDSQDPTYR